MYPDNNPPPPLPEKTQPEEPPLELPDGETQFQRPAEVATEMAAMAAPDLTESRPAAPHDPIKEAFSLFYREYVPKLFAYLRYLGASPEEAAECAQDTLIKALSHWESLRSPQAWCRTVAGREYARRSFGSEEPFEEVPATGKPLIAAGTDFEEFEQRHHIFELMRKLPPKQRQVMAMTLDDATPSQIASDLGLTPEQVRSNLRLARKRLAGFINGDAKDGEGSE